MAEQLAEENRKQTVKSRQTNHCSALSSVPVLAFEFETARAEIQQQADLFGNGVEIIDKLNLVHRVAFLHSLESKNDVVVYNNIRLEITDQNPIIINFDRDLLFYFESSFAQFVSQRIFINALDESKPELGMDLHRRANDFASQFVSSL